MITLSNSRLPQPFKTIFCDDNSFFSLDDIFLSYEDGKF